MGERFKDKKGGFKMKCLSCKSETMIDSKTTYFAHLPNCYLIIENVPCKKCSQCGEEVFPMSVMERIDNIIENVGKFASKVCVLEYHQAA